MNFHVLTLFPEMIENGMNTSITGRAITKGLLTLEAVNIRDYAFNKHQKVDDYTYGGGAGMLMQAEPVYLAYEAIANRTAKKPRVVYLTPQGQVFNQAMAREMAQEEPPVPFCHATLPDGCTADTPEGFLQRILSHRTPDCSVHPEPFLKWNPS